MNKTDIGLKRYQNDFYNKSYDTQKIMSGEKTEKTEEHEIEHYEETTIDFDIKFSGVQTKVNLFDSEIDISILDIHSAIKFANENINEVKSSVGYLAMNLGGFTQFSLINNPN
jgi:hypothetical protein